MSCFRFESWLPFLLYIPLILQGVAVNKGRTVFSQLMDFLPRLDFDECVKRYGGDHRVRNFTCYEQFMCMAFAQLTGRESLRDIEACLRAVETKLYHAGISSRVSRSTLADANENRDWRIYQDFGRILIEQARRLHADEEFAVRLKATTYALDSTTIDLCLELFPWASFRKNKAAVKMHTLLDLRGNIPSFIGITDGKSHDVHFLDDLPKEPGAFYVMDRAYNDFKRLYEFERSKAFFVVRAKTNMQSRWRCSRPVNKSSGIRSDQSIVLTGSRTKTSYPVELRRISYFDKEREKRLVFLTNNFILAPITIARLYKSRWEVELFFKWIKQHLRIKSFYGTSENAVKTQIWIAISSYLLVAIVRQRLGVERSLYEILNILEILIFEKTALDEALSCDVQKYFDGENPNQPLLFDS